MSEEAPVGVAGAVAARGRAGRAFVFQRFPGKRGAVEGSFLLPAGCEGAPRCAPVRGVFATDVSKPNAARNRTPGHREKKKYSIGMKRDGSKIKMMKCRK